MKGVHWFKIGNNHVQFNIRLKRKVTIIKGDSGTGKTTLVDFIRQYLESQVSGDDSGLSFSTNINRIIILNKGDIDWQIKVRNASGALLVADEGVRYLFSRAFSGIFNNIDCYLLCVTRENTKLGCLNYAISDIYGLTTKRNGEIYQTELYNLYKDNVEDFKADEVITEDSGSGYLTLSNVFKVPVVSSSGESWVLKRRDVLEGVSRQISDISQDLKNY